jgi:mono/diheme cytochrome c family protein
MAIVLFAGLVVGGCHGRPHFSEPLALAGGVEISPDVLDEGWGRYSIYCNRCHGEKGDGRGPSSAGMSPPPRDFTRGVFKVAGDELPDDDDLVELLWTGMPGTSMPAFHVPEGERRAIVQYLKTFSGRWRTESPRSTRSLSERP